VKTGLLEGKLRVGKDAVNGRVVSAMRGASARPRPLSVAMISSTISTASIVGPASHARPSSRTANSALGGGVTIMTRQASALFFGTAFWGGIGGRQRLRPPLARCSSRVPYYVDLVRTRNLTERRALWIERTAIDVATGIESALCVGVTAGLDPPCAGEAAWSASGSTARLRLQLALSLRAVGSARRTAGDDHTSPGGPRVSASRPV